MQNTDGKSEREENYLEAEEERERNGDQDTDSDKEGLSIQRPVEASEQENWMENEPVGVVVKQIPPIRFVKTEKSRDVRFGERELRKKMNG